MPFGGHNAGSSAWPSHEEQRQMTPYDQSRNPAIPVGWLRSVRDSIDGDNDFVRARSVDVFEPPRSRYFCKATLRGADVGCYRIDADPFSTMLSHFNEHAMLCLGAAGNYGPSHF